MFCVKCGKDVGGFKFCPHCGTQVPGEGASEQMPISVECVYGDYAGGVQGFQLARDRMVVLSWRLLDWKIKYNVPYDAIRAVKYTRADNMVGEVRVAWDEGGKTQEARVVFAEWRNLNRFCAFVYAVRCLVQHPIGVFVDVPAVSAEELGRQYGAIDWDGLFRQFGTDRYHAIEKVRRVHAVPEKEARKLVDIAFEARQIRCYEEDPWAAVRDLVKIRKEWDEWIEMRQQERERSAEQRRRFMTDD